MNTRADLLVLIPLLVILGAALTLPHFLRDDNTLIGGDSYYNLRLAENPLSTHDDLSYGGRTSVIHPYALLLYSGSFISGKPLEPIGFIIPYIIALLILGLFYLILRNHEFSKLFSSTSTVLLALSPPFFYLANTITDHALVILLILAAYYLHQKHRTTPAIFLIILTAFFGFYQSLIAIMLLSIHGLRTKKYPIFPVLLIFIIGLIPYILYGIPAPQPSQLTTRTSIESLLIVLGGVISFSIFAIVLAFFGLRTLWKEQYAHLSLYVLIIALFVFTLFNSLGVLYFNIPFIFLTALGLSQLLNTKWTSPILQHIITGILLLGIILSILLYIQSLSISDPAPEVFEAFQALQEREPNMNITIASHPDNGHWITSIGGRKNVIDTAYSFAPNPQERWEDLQILFHTRDFSETQRIIEKYNITYIYIDSDMKNGQVWNAPDEGLLFFLDASTKFKSIYKGDTIEIWGVEL